MKEAEFQLAGPSEQGAILKLLKKSGLPHENLASHMADFIVTKSSGKVIGVVGLELLGCAARCR